MSDTRQEESTSNSGSDNEQAIINEMLEVLQAHNSEALGTLGVINDTSSEASISDTDEDMEIPMEENFVLWNHSQIFDQLERIREMVHSQQSEVLTSDSDDDDASDRYTSVLETLQSEEKLILGSSTNRLDHFDSEPIYHSNCSVSTRHFQLRHQIWCHHPPSEAALKSYFAATQNEEEVSHHINPEVLSQFDDYVYFVYNWYIMKLNHKTGKASIVKALNYYPQAMHVAYGFVTCCGSSGQMTIINLFDTNIIFHHDNVSNGTLNNYVHIAFFSSRLHVLCCSNSCTIKVWELMDASIRDVGSISEQEAINFCQVSPDGKKMVSVGDTADIALYTLRERDADNSICSNKKILCFPDTLGDGFSVSWDSTSTLFAVARLTPGIICVWNADTLDLVYAIKPTTSDATCLSVKFFEPEDGLYAQPIPPEKRFTAETLLAPKRRSSMLLFTQRVLTAHLVHLSKKTEQTFSALTHPKLKEHIKNETEQEEEQQLFGIQPGESDVRPIPKSFTRNCWNLSPKIGGATFSSDYSKIFIGYENFIVEYRLRGPRTLLESCILYLRQSPEVWANKRIMLPYDLLEKLEATHESSLHL